MVIPSATKYQLLFMTQLAQIVFISMGHLTANRR
jgi:hypothetical protein